MPLYLTEAEVAELLGPADAVEAVEACFRRLAAGEIENVPRQRTRWEEGSLAVMWAVDRELGLAGLKTYAAGREGATFVVLLFETETTKNVAVIEQSYIGAGASGRHSLGTAVFGIRFQADFGGDALRSLATANTLRQSLGGERPSPRPSSRSRSM